MRGSCLLAVFCGCFTIGELVTVNNCGVSRPQGRIIGGIHADHGEFPYMVSLHKRNDTFAHWCGGTVLNENWVLTAAHCLFGNRNPSDYKIIAGLHNITEHEHPVVQIFQVSKLVLHENYSNETMANDVALLKTHNPIDISGSKGYVNGICLPSSNVDPTDAKVIGWGHTVENGTVSIILREVEVPIVPRDKCKKVYGDYVTENNMCAGADNKDACQYDSGGPLFTTDENGVATLVATVLGGFSCGESRFPGVYTKVFPYINWIKNVILQDKY